MIFLLGGPPRVGKSAIANEIRQKYALSFISTDSICAVLENILSPETAPDLFVFDEFNKMSLGKRTELITKNPAEFIGYVRKESYVVWKAVDAFIRRENDEGRDALIEGVAVLPELVSRLENLPHRAVFIGNQGVHLKEKMKKFATKNEYDWLRNTSDQYISAFALFVRQMSVYIEQEAKKYGFEYIEIDKELFGNVPIAVLKSLGMQTD